MTTWNDIVTTDNSLGNKMKKDPTLCMTKPEMAKILIERIKFKDGDVVIEPCRGDGAFYNNLLANVEKKYCEILEGLDYLEFNENVDITLSNPPFVPRKLFWSFMEKAMTTTRREIYWLINLSSLNVFTPKRLKEMEQQDWFINNMFVCADKRWFGRYVWVKITKEKTNFIEYTPKIF